MAHDSDKRYWILNNVLIIASSSLLAYTLIQIIQKESMGVTALLYREKQAGVVFMSLAIVCIMVNTALRTRLPFFAPTLIPVVLFAVSSLEFLRLGFGDGFSALWIFVIPPLVYFTAGKKIGFSFSLAIFAGMLILLLFPRFSVYYYLHEKIIRIITVYILLVFAAHIYEYVRSSKEKKLRNLNELLKAERDEFSAMKNSLKTSLFLMNKDMVIQDNYSPLMETMFGVSGLSGKKFTDMLTSSLTSAEVATITDYFDMVSERRFDADMLDDINPLQELKYKCTGGGPVKILRCIFTPIDRISGERVIMGNVEDITAKVQMQKRLQMEQDMRQEQMNNLFDMLHVDTVVFYDFLEDAEYEFEAVNNILKNSRLPSKEALASIFQSIHAIKANSIIIGLNSYSSKIHDIETYIKDLQAKPDVVFDDMLNLTVRIESLMKAEDEFKANIEKIKSFSYGENRKNTADILFESLKRAAYRTAGDIGKKVVMDAGGVDSDALENAPRRIVKEVLLQLVRNAVFHGIESPEVRIKTGKKEYGTIKVALNREGGKIHIKLQDDGKGLDFEKIKERARNMHIIKNNESIKDKNRIFQVIFMPGFSTVESASMHAGRGVGLNLVWTRIKEYNGAIKTQTEAGKGTIFHIFLPVKESAGGEN